MSNQPILEVKHLSKHFDGNGVLKDVSFTLAEGEVIVVVGPSGCGKSTLLRCINALEPIQGGAVRLNGVQGRACEAYVPRGGSTRIDFWVTVPEGSGGIGVEATPTVAGEAG